MDDAAAKERRSADPDNTDTITGKKRKLTEDDPKGSSPVKNLLGAFDRSKKNALKRTQVDDSNEVVSKKLKLGDFKENKESSELELAGNHQKERRKPYHQRMKHTINLVLQQMEFYFGNSSLSKDRYLKSMIDSSPDGYVDLSIFANFNKLQTLHKDGISLNVLIQALSHSKMLQLNEDKTKVRRVTPFQEISQEETDRRTIYVEYLPSHATHMWVKQVFSQCGRVEYVSLPTYKTSKQIKGFAFVEFEKPEEAERACSMLNNPLPDKVMERPGKFPKTNKSLDRLQKLAPPCPDPVKNNEKNSAEDKEEDHKSTTADSETKKRKKKKAKRKKPQEGSADDGANETAEAASSAVEHKSDVKRKKKKRKRKLSTTQEQSATQDDAASEKTETENSGKKVKKQGDKDKDKDSEAPSQIASEDDKAGGEDAQGNDNTLQVKKKKKKRKKSKGEGTGSSEELVPKQAKEEKIEKVCSTTTTTPSAQEKDLSGSCTEQSEKKLSHKERKLLRQEDIRRKRQLKLENPEFEEKSGATETAQKNGSDSRSSENLKELDGTQPTSILKLKKAAEKKRVEFDPVPITNEFVEAKGARKRKKHKKEKPHLRVISKHEWLSLKEEYIDQQKSHMKALKESLRELRQQENREAGRPYPKQTVDLEDVFGTKPLRLSNEEKMASIEKMKFTPNVIVQWWCSHEMHRDKIRTMFKESHASSIAYIDAQEEAKSGYIRFKDETSAEEFAKMSRTSDSFMARVLPVDQQKEYWEKANADRMKKLGRKKKEQGCDRIARKMFQRNKATFFNKPNRIVFDDAEEKQDDVKESEEEKAEPNASPSK
ncbi:hypothetical protein EGW08_012913 [Elysia chlorotica]|uniref:La-related protein 7 n=1 Tax=Elysia chlorotica TaxID=188477 RepID=A0A3S1BF44_ELYCH|nr:hypothetical protein EGW08_012913 [Elysia chlorotica]